MTDLNEHATPSKPRRILRRILSHHGIATLLLLLHSPIDVAAKPEIPMLQEAGLVESIPLESGGTGFQLTEDGSAVLRGLGLR